MTSKFKFKEPPSKGDRNRNAAKTFRQTKRDEGEVAKNCYFYKDGDNKFAGVKVCINPRRYKRIEALIQGELFCQL